MTSAEFLKMYSMRFCAQDRRERITQIIFEGAINVEWPQGALMINGNLSGTGARE